MALLLGGGERIGIVIASSSGPGEYLQYSVPFVINDYWIFTVFKSTKSRLVPYLIEWNTS